MASGTRKCKICGKIYPYCNTVRPAGVFRWQDVCCCEEHASTYFAQVLAARSVVKTAEDEIDITEELKELEDDSDDDDDEIELEV